MEWNGIEWNRMEWNGEEFIDPRLPKNTTSGKILFHLTVYCLSIKHI